MYSWVSRYGKICRTYQSELLYTELFSHIVSFVIFSHKFSTNISRSKQVVLKHPQSTCAVLCTSPKPGLYNNLKAHY